MEKYLKRKVFNEESTQQEKYSKQKVKIKSSKNRKY